MKSVVTAAVAALLAGGMSVGALGTAFAQDAASPPAQSQPAAGPQQGQAGQWHGPGRRHMGHLGNRGGFHRGGGVGMLALACGDRGAEALEIAFVHLYYSVKPTDAQQPLFDTLKTAALADQKTFAQACQGAMAKAGGQQPTMLDRLQDRLTLEQARATALGDIVPKFKAFYDSLSADQKAKLDQPHHRRFGMQRRVDGQQGGWQQHGPGGMRHRPMPPDAPATPADAQASSST